VTRHHPVEKMPQRRKMLFSGGNAGRLTEPRKIHTDVARRDADQLKPPRFGPREELIHRRKVGAAGVVVADGAEEKLLGRKDGGRSGAAHDVGQLAGGAGRQSP